MKATLIVSVFCAVVLAAPTPDGLVSLLDNSNLEADGILSNDNILASRDNNPVVDILDGGAVEVTDTLKDINVGKGLVSNLKKETRDNNPVVDILDGGEVGVAESLKDINVGKGLVSNLKKETRDETLPTVASILAGGEGIGADDIKDINIARDNGVVEILQDGAGIIHDDMEDINIL